MVAGTFTGNIDASRKVGQLTGSLAVSLHLLEAVDDTLDGFYAALGSREYDDLSVLLDDEVTWDAPSSLPSGVRLHGPAEVTRWLSSFPQGPYVLERRMTFRLAAERFEVRGVHRHSEPGVPIGEIPFVHRLDVRDGRVATFSEHLPDGILRANVTIQSRRDLTT